MRVKRVDKDERRHAKLRLIAGLQRGQSWHQAQDDAGLRIGRATAYRLLEQVRRDGDGAFIDRRQGHARKVRAPVRQWLEDYCRGAPHSSGRQIHVALQDRFGLGVSVSQINRVRATLGLSRQAAGAGRGWRECPAA